MPPSWHTENLALLGAVPAVMALAAVVGELMTRTVGTRLATVVGQGLLVVGLGVVTAAFPARSLIVLFVGALVAGAGLGLAFLGALATVNDLLPDHRRAELTAAFYVWLFAGNGLPVLVIGFLTPVITLAGAIYLFAASIGLLALTALALTITTPARPNDRTTE